MKELRFFVVLTSRKRILLGVVLLAWVVLALPAVAEETSGNLRAHQFGSEESLAGEAGYTGGWISPEELALQQNPLYTSPLVISAAAFGADGFNPDSFFFPFGGGYMQGDAEAYGCMQSAAYLPNGVTVDNMFVSVYDNDVTFNISTSLWRVDNFTGTVVTMATAATTVEFDGVQVVSDSTIGSPLIVYPDYSYYVTTCVLSSSIRLYSVRLYYTTP